MAEVGVVLISMEQIQVDLDPKEKAVARDPAYAGRGIRNRLAADQAQQEKADRRRELKEAEEGLGIGLGHENPATHPAPFAGSNAVAAQFRSFRPSGVCPQDCPHHVIGRVEWIRQAPGLLPFN